MNYYYHPITGLKYDSIEPILTIDVCGIPESLSVDTFLQKYMESREQVYETGIEIYPQVTMFSQITDYGNL